MKCAHSLFKYPNISLYSGLYPVDQQNSINNNYELEVKLVIDSNFAEEIRLLIHNKKSSNRNELLKVIDFAARKSSCFDSSFFILENSEEFLDLNNNRPYETLLAIEEINYQLNSSIKKRNITELTGFVNSLLQDEQFSRFISRREVIYLFLLILYQEIWAGNNFETAFENVIMQTYKITGKLAKLELYYAWKILHKPSKYRFFQTGITKNEKIKKTLKGMSGDLILFRYLELFSKFFSDKIFTLPLLFTFDKKYSEWFEEIKIKATIIERKNYFVNSIFYDEEEFQNCLNNVLIRNDMLNDFIDPKKIENRIKSDLEINSIRKHIIEYENKLFTNI